MESLFLKLGLEWDNAHNELFQETFTHRSAVNENSSYDLHNERLEFLGDAVLELFVTKALFFRYPEKTEGELTSLRSALVKGHHLAEVARRLDLGTYIILSPGEKKSGGADKDYLLANLVEAFIGALYIAYGEAEAKTFIDKHILCDLENIIAEEKHIDAKSKFQEIAQQSSIGITPHYEVLSHSGKDHEKVFIVGAFLGPKQVGKGTGGSKKEAQVLAATDALQHEHLWNS